MTSTSSSNSADAAKGDNSGRPDSAPDETSRDAPSQNPRQAPERNPRPPDSIPNLIPGVDPQQTPGIDHVPAENDQPGTTQENSV